MFHVELPDGSYVLVPVGDEQGQAPFVFMGIQLNTQNFWKNNSYT
jgi:hypothetical protein